MSREVDRILGLVRGFFLFLQRVIETILLRLKDAQGSLTDTVRGTLPKGARTKVAVIQRGVARGIDLLLVVLIAALVWYPIGPFLGIAYSLLADGFHKLGFRGQSIGKRIVGLRVVRAGDGRPAGWRESALRNLPAGIATFFAIIPLWGWVFFVLVGVPLALIELFLMLRLENETRLGDVMADTRVLEVR